MKTSIIALIISFFTFGNSNTIFGNDNVIYKNIIDEDSTTTISLYEGKDEKNLVPLKQYVITYSEDNLPQTKEIYQWDKRKHRWTKFEKYEYIYDGKKHAELMIHYEWNKTNKQWENAKSYPMYLLDVDKRLLSANQ